MLFHKIADRVKEAHFSAKNTFFQQSGHFRCFCHPIKHKFISILSTSISISVVDRVANIKRSKYVNSEGSSTLRTQPSTQKSRKKEDASMRRTRVCKSLKYTHQARLTLRLLRLRQLLRASVFILVKSAASEVSARVRESEGNAHASRRHSDQRREHVSVSIVRDEKALLFVFSLSFSQRETPVIILQMSGDDDDGNAAEARRAAKQGWTKRYWIKAQELGLVKITVWLSLTIIYQVLGAWLYTRIEGLTTGEEF